jgi:hypothetical protein
MRKLNQLSLFNHFRKLTFPDNPNQGLFNYTDTKSFVGFSNKFNIRKIFSINLPSSDQFGHLRLSCFLWVVTLM